MDKIFDLIIDSSLEGHRIEYVLEKHIGLSTALIRRLKRTADSVMLNGKHASVVERVYVGDKLHITVTGRASENIIPIKMPLDILFEDEDVIAVNKPPLMPTHPSRNHQMDTLANGVIHYLGEGTVFHAITRLDRETSGVVLIAKNSFAAKLLSEDMKNKKIKKEYVAVLSGIPIPQNGEVDAPIKRKEERNIMRCVAADGKDAVTLYQTEKVMGELSLVKLSPVTGRTHQLRVHMSYIGNPIYGDSMYGAPQCNERTRLHCRSLTFCRPMTKEEITVIAPVPHDILCLS